MSALRKFVENLPRRPHCTNDPRLGLTARNAAEALTFSHIQPNQPGKVVWLVFDVDHVDGATSWDRNGAPPPTMSVENPKNGHAHLFYALETPVARTGAARPKPLFYLAALQEALRRKLDSDPGYSGHICKNPTHERWRDGVIEWNHVSAYSFAHLSDWVDLPSAAEMTKRVRDPDYAGLGRNCELYERLRVEAYRLVKAYWVSGGFEPFREALRYRGDELNAEHFGYNLLPVAEVKNLAWSIARWVYSHFTPQDFREIQAARGAKKGKAKREILMPEVLRLIGEGKSQREVAAAVGVGVMTVNGWLKRPA